jgi:hypothetical protein
VEAIELRNRKTPLICTIAITFILLVSLSGTHPLQDLLLTDAPSGAKALASLESQELVSDPDLASPPEVFVVGESGEFSHDYDTDGEDGRALLVWNHTAGTPLDFPAFPEHQLIDCDDFIYLFQPLVWESETTPYRVRVIMEYGFDVTGTFKTNESGWIMFRAFAYLITPHYWTALDWWIPPINGTPQSFLINLGEHTIDSAWSDLEYPLSDIRLAIGFAPSYQFNRFWDGSEPWRNYTGVVTMTVEGIDVKALRGRPASVEEIEPVHVGYKSQSSDEYIVDVEHAGDGSVYSLSVNYDPEACRTTLVRWSENADVLWSSKTNSSCSIRGDAIDVYNGNVYAIGMHTPSTGNRNPILLRWNSDGALTLAKDLSLELDGVFDLKIANDDSIYLTGYRHLWEISHWTSEHLIKIDCVGTEIWEVTLGTDSLSPALLELSEEGDVYVSSGHSFTKWNRDANLLWNKTGLFFDLGLSPSGSVYTIEVTFSEWSYYYWVPHIYLVERDSDGAVLWNHSIDIHFTETWSEHIWPNSMEVAIDGSLYIFFGIVEDEQKFRLAKYNSSGIQLWNKSLAALNNESSYWFNGKMVLGRNGLVHIVGMHHNLESDDLNLRMLVYFDSDYPVDPFSLPEIGLAIAFSVIAVLVVGDVVRRRRGLRFRT